MVGASLYSVYSKFPEQLLRQLDPPPKVEVTTDPVTGVIQYIIGVRNFTVILSRMHDAEIPKHLAGFEGFIRKIYGGKPGRRGQRIIDQMKRSKMVLGVNIKPDGVDIDLPLNVVYIVAMLTQSIVFIDGSLTDANGNLILAPNQKFEKHAVIDPAAPAKPWYRFW